MIWIILYSKSITKTFYSSNWRLLKYIINYSPFSLEIYFFMLTFAADKHNSITNKRKVARKNERNDNDNGQMPSGSKTEMKQVCESTGGLYLVVRCVLWHIATSVEGFVIGKFHKKYSIYAVGWHLCALPIHSCAPPTGAYTLFTYVWYELCWLCEM